MSGFVPRKSSVRQFVFYGLRVCLGPIFIGDFLYSIGIMLCTRSIDEWIEKFKIDCTSVVHEGAGCPRTSTSDDNANHVCELILPDRQITTDEVTNCPEISYGSGYEIIHNRLRFYKVCARRELK